MAIKIRIQNYIQSSIRDFNKWSLFTVAIVCFISIPLITIVVNLKEGVGDMWGHLVEYLLLDYAINSFYLLIGSGILSLLFGVPTAWLISNYEFKFRKILNALLYIPLAIPSYIMSYVYVGLVGYGGTLNQLSFGLFPHIDMMNIWGLIFVLSISLYPYVYASSRVMFSSAHGSIKESALLLGISDTSYFWRIALPMASPAIIGGLFLVFMEVLNDYGAAKYYGVNTFTTGIFRTWTALEDLQSAVYLAAILVIFVFVLLFINKYARGKKSYSNTESTFSGEKERSTLKGHKRWSIPLICATPFVFGFLLPLLQLSKWAYLNFLSQFNLEHIFISLQSMILAGVTALITIIFTLCLIYFPTWNRLKTMKPLVKITTVGYIIPGGVIGITLVASSSYLVNSVYNLFEIEIGHMVYSSIYVLVFAYLFRFLAVAYNPIEAHSLRIGSNISESSYMLGKSKMYTFYNIQLPLLKSSLLSGFLIVFIDVMKELPLTLLLKPYQMQTLAIKAYEFADDERISEAAIPSLTLIGLVCFAMYLISKFRDE